MTSKSSPLKHLLSRAKMLFALLGISAFFSAATLTSRIPGGVDAAPHLIAALSKQASTEDPILIVLSRSPEDRELGAVLQARQSGGSGRCGGDPEPARGDERPAP